MRQNAPRDAPVSEIVVFVEKITILYYNVQIEMPETDNQSFAYMEGAFACVE
jgi:hypothetical protein